MPALKDAGNVLRPYTAFKLSLRTAAAGRCRRAAASLKRLLEDNAPYNAKVTFHADGRADAAGATGWNAPSSRPGCSRRSMPPRRGTSARPAATSARAARSR
jgi:hypothetical protein